MISREEQIYNCIKAYIQNYGIQTFIKMTPHVIDKHLMYRHIREGIRTLYEIEDAKEADCYGFGINNML